MLFRSAGRRPLDVRGAGEGWSAHEARHVAEEAAEDLRDLYVALTRAQSQVVTWWAPTTTTQHGPLHRMVFGRQPGTAHVPEVVQVRDDEYAARILDLLTQLGALTHEVVEPADPSQRLEPAAAGPAPALEVRRFERGVDTAWTRTSYSALIRVEEQAAAATSEPEIGRAHV